jgi:RND family efflux transporter MFP subunit
MKINRRVIYWITAFVLVFITFWFGYVHKFAEQVPPEKPVPVEVEVVSTDSIEETIELTGWMKANKVVDVKSKVQGRIESLQVILDGGGSVDLEEGLAVKKGQQLAVIDHDVYLAQVAAAKASVKTSEVELADAEREKKRIVALYEGGSATEQSRDKAVTATELAKARLTLAESNLELAQINLRESTIISPIDGIVTAKHIDEGNLIRAGDRIATVADMKIVKVIVAVAEKYGADIAVRTPVKIKVDAFGERIFTTRVYSIYPALDAETHMMQVEIRLQNDELLLKPGTFAKVTLITNRKDDVVVIPRDVVLGGRIDDKPYVYVVEDKIGHKRFVKLGITQADKFEITEGLRAGEILVVNGMNYLADGMSVEVVRIEDIK